ncbi:MAG: Na+/H+ antiporter NhaA [Chitinophagaceae bacterium]|jgi:NhaA family Na+:H+ antiporter
MIGDLKNKFIHPLKEILHDSRSIGIILLLCTAISLIIANLPSISAGYQNFWEHSFDGTTNHHLHIGILDLPNSFILVINDFLMAFFFFLAGMEIKRELVLGELSSLKKSLLPILAAIGGMLVPAILFSLFNKGDSHHIAGWAIPTATDIAFTLGVASLLGNKVPVALKIFITALAIIDDLGAIIVIALFYGGQIKFMFLLACAIIVAAIYALNKLKVKFGIVHIVLGLVLWYCMFNSGIHATVAGVVLAFLIPVNQLSKFELKIHAPVYFLIMPLFALANTAITFPTNIAEALNGNLSWGIIAGLLLGKPIGICLASYFMVHKNYAQLPTKTNWNQMIGASILCGIGFTMSIFIATLAFTSVEEQNISKISVLLASAAAMIIGFIWLKFSKATPTTNKSSTEPIDEYQDEAFENN